MKAAQHRLNKCGEKFWLMFYVFIMSTIYISILPFSFASAAPLAVTQAELTGSGVNTDSVQRLYVAYFNRPADPAGLAAFEALLSPTVAATQADLTTLAGHFNSSSEYAALYAGQSNAQIIDSLYMNLFGRHCESIVVQNTWAGWLTDGTYTFSQIALQLTYSAQGTDATAIANKLAAATVFTTALDTSSKIAGYSGTAAAARVRAWLATVTDVAATLTAAIDSVATVADPLSTPTIPATSTPSARPPGWMDFGTVLTNGVQPFSPSKIAVGLDSLYIASMDGIYKSPLSEPAFDYLWQGWPGATSPTRISLNKLENPVIGGAKLGPAVLTQLGKVLIWDGAKFILSTLTPAPTSGAWWYGIPASLALDPFSGDIYLAGNLKVQKSTDNGLTYNALFDLGTLGAGTGSGGLVGYVYTLEIMPWGELFLGGETKSIYHSTNGGVSWSAIPKHDKAGNRYGISRTKDGEVMISDCSDTAGRFMWLYTSSGRYVPAMTGLQPWEFNSQTSYGMNMAYTDSGEIFMAVRFEKTSIGGHIIRWNGATWSLIDGEPSGPTSEAIHANSIGTDGRSIYTQTLQGQVKRWTPTTPLPYTVSLGNTPINKPLSGGSLTGTLSKAGNYTYTWSARSDAGTVTFGSPAAPSTSLDFSAAGDYVVNLKVSDGTVTAGDSLIVHVQ